MSSISELNQGWTFTALDGDQHWLPIAVPGDINAAQFAAGEMPDPHVKAQFDAYFPNSAKRWLYRNTFASPAFKENAELVFEGVTGRADIRLNGQLLGKVENAHRPHRFEVGKLLKPLDNCLEVEFEPIETSVGAPRRDSFGWGNERTYLRVPPFNYGWDWSVAVPAIGLSGNVFFECDNAFKFVNVNYMTPKAGRADFFFEVSRGARNHGYDIRVRLFGHGFDQSKLVHGQFIKVSYADVEREPTEVQFKTFCSITVPDAKLWFPIGYGEPSLYSYEVELLIDGQVADVVRGRLGFRTVRIEENPFREPYEPGFSYEILVNDVPVFVKGANWIPVELWPGTAREESYRQLLELSRDAHFTMLRIWGGGVYEKDLFYDLCDEYGIMVWQDFMFASNAYQVGPLREEIKKEADYQLKRLRVHPCICHWCGINEDIFSWSYPGCGRQATWRQADVGDYSGTGSWQLHDDPEIYSMILRGLTSQLGNDVPYIESSPASRGDCGNLPQSGNCHVSCRKYMNLHPGNFRGHFDQFCSFDSEFGVQGPDSAKATRGFLGEENCRVWPPTGEVATLWTRHLQRGAIPLWQEQANQAEQLFGKIDSFDTFIKYGQAVHLEMMRAEFEYRRAERPDCGGTMTWMLNDCWPTGNWSIINYYMQPKPVYYAAKHACAPKLPIVISRREQVEFFFDNQTLSTCFIQGTYGLMALDGTILKEKSVCATVEPNALFAIDAWPLSDDSRKAGDHYFLKLEGYDMARCFADDWFGIPWPEQPNVVLQDLGNGMIRVTAKDAFARLVHLAPVAEQDVRFSDNYFDLGPGEYRDIQTMPALAANQLKALHWMTSWE